MAHTLYELTQPFELLLNLMQSGDIDEETYKDTISSLDLADKKHTGEKWMDMFFD